MSSASGLPSGGGTGGIVAMGVKAVKQIQRARQFANTIITTSPAVEKVDKKWPPIPMGGH